jgi:hypothetical protein
MMTPYLVTKSPKSIGIAILLTFLLGPIGLFYASVSGGLIMTFGPIFLYLLFIVGIIQDNFVLMGWSLGLLLIFALTFWLISIIWAVISVRSYNKEIEDDAKRQLDLWNRLHEKDQSQFAVNINQNSPDLKISSQGIIEGSAKPNLQDWLKNNPGMTINDYFSKFGR